ncbi:MAG: hypothetical protein D6761_03370 [Candidatus Dadabacteria bacterium]|nr:MAG: hypothetical protein D6761_03370 [Candidatus Dadabacteria bacterium]
MGGKQKAKTAAGGEGAAEWKQAFFRQPYLRDVLIDHAVIADTFETAIPWHRAADFYQEVRSTVLDALNEVCGGGAVLCRSTHAYPDGVALYFSFYGTGRHGDLIDQWWTLKRAAQEAVFQGGGTASHHHAMGRDHREWGQRELPEGAIAALRAIKASCDPGGIMNPGVCP